MRRRKVLGLLVGFLTAVLGLRLVWVFLITPRMGVSKIVLESELSISDEQLISLMELGGDTWVTLSERTLEERLETYPVVREAKVVKVFPDELRVFLYRRRLVATALSAAGNVTVPIMFDEEGYVVQTGPGAADLSLPVLSGVSFLMPRVGERLPDSLIALTADLAVLKRYEEDMFSLISEIELLPQTGGDYEMKLYMNHVSVPVLVEKGLKIDTMRRMFMVLDILNDLDGKVIEADIRGGQTVFRRDEEA